MNHSKLKIIINVLIIPQPQAQAQQLNYLDII